MPTIPISNRPPGPSHFASILAAAGLGWLTYDSYRRQVLAAEARRPVAS